MTSNMAISPPELVTFAISDNDDIIKKKKKMGFFPHFKEIHFIMVFILFFSSWVMGSLISTSTMEIQPMY